MSTSNQGKATPVVRTPAGLRDAMFDELDSLRNKQSNANIANAKARLAAVVIETVRMEIEIQNFIQKQQATKHNGPFGTPIALGVSQ